MIKYKSSIITIVVMLFIVAIITLFPKNWSVPDIWLLWFCLAFLVYIAALLSDRLKK